LLPRHHFALVAAHDELFTAIAVTVLGVNLAGD
jgi:hypothetical protein